MKIFSQFSFKFKLNPFVPSAPFLYPLRTSDKCFQRIEKECIGNKWGNTFNRLVLKVSLPLICQITSNKADFAKSEATHSLAVVVEFC